jgi:hypothetical protein
MTNRDHIQDDQEDILMRYVEMNNTLSGGVVCHLASRRDVQLGIALT